MSKLNANELMIGDWVFCTYKQQNYKIAEIKTVAGDELKIVVYDENIPLVFQMKYFEPIPITAEILEKNGFVEDKKIKCYTYEEEKTLKRLIQIFTHFGDFDCHIVSKNFDADMRLSYVHELQHALRLCGIDKEIVL